MQSKINFRQSRNLGDTIEAAFAFIKENLMPLIKAIAFISGPFIVIGGIGFGLFYSVMFSSTLGGGVPDPLMFQQMGLQMFLMYVGLFAGSLVFYSTVYSFIYLYINGQDTAVSSVWKEVKKNLFRTFKVLFGSLFVLGVTMSLTVGLIFFLFFSGGGLGIFLGFISSMLVFVPVFYLGITLSLVMNVSLYEQKGFFASLRRSFSLISGKWWRTFGVLFVFMLIYGGISFVFSLPMYGALMGTSLTQPSEMESSSVLAIGIAASSAFFLVGSYFVSSILLIGINFHYFSLVEEKDASGLLDRISSFGTGSSEVKNVEEY